MYDYRSGVDSVFFQRREVSGHALRRRDPQYPYLMNNTPLNVTKKEKDLGVCVIPDLKPTVLPR